MNDKLGYRTPAAASTLASLKTLKRLAREARPHVKPIALVQAIGLGIAGLSAAIPFGLKYLTTELETGDTSILLWVPAVAFLVAAALGVGRGLQVILSSSIATRIGKELQERVYNHYLAIDFQKHLVWPVGAKLARITHEIQVIVQGLSVFLSNMLFAPVMLAIFAALMIATNWKLAIVAAIVAPANLALSLMIGRRVKKLTHGMQEQYVQLSRHVIDTLGEIVLVKLFGRESLERERFTRLAEENRRLRIHSAMWSAAMGSVNRIVNAFSVCLVLWVGFYLLTGPAGELTRPDLVKFAALLYFFHAEIVKVGNGVRTLSAAGVGCERVFGMLDGSAGPASAAPPSAARAKKLPAFASAIVIENISFGYGSAPVLRDVNLTLRRGERIALCGISGAGKTSLIRLLVGLLAPERGSVKMDGIDMREVAPEEWIKLFTVAPQNPVLFNVSIRENIAYGRPEASAAEIEHAATLACADGFIRDLSDGYDTVAGESGRRLSSGQRQRITIARALLREAPILVLDEPCSDLDARTEQEVFSNLAGLENRTVVLISHRLNAIRSVDRIYFLADGRITESGTHEELMRQSDDYRNLYALQVFGNTGENGAEAGRSPTVK